MARYELTGPDGKRYEVQAPDTATQEEVLARFQKEIGASKPVTTGDVLDKMGPAFTPEEAEVANQPMSDAERKSRLLSSYVPGSERIRGLTYAAIPGLLDPRIDSGTFGDKYDRARRIAGYRDDLAHKDQGAGDIATRTAGLALVTAMTGAGGLLKNSLGEAPTMLEMMKEGGRIGGGIAAPVSYLNSRSPDAEGKIGDVLTGTAGGMALGSATPPLFALARKMTFPGWRGRRAEERSQNAQSVLSDFDNADVPRVGVAASDRPALQQAALDMLPRTAGAPLRREVEASVGGLENRLGEAISPLGRPAQTPAEFGSNAQDALRHNLRGRNYSSRELDAMTPEELAAVRGRGGFNPDATYPDQFGARYRLAEQEPVPGYGTAADVRGNFVDRLPVRPIAGAPEHLGDPTNTYTLLNELGREARASGRLKGWRDGDFESPQFWNAMKSHFGDDIGSLLQSEYARRAAGQANLTIPGLRDIRTAVRRTYEDAASGDPAARGTGNRAALQRLHGAMTDDIQEILNASGGSSAALRYLNTDQGYSAFTRDLRQPLRRVFGDDVAPDEAFRRLYDATQRQTADSRLVGAFYKVMADKGDPRAATQALLAPSIEGGMQGFMRAFNNLSPDARRIMQQHSPELMMQLDGLMKAGQHLAPFQAVLDRAAQGLPTGRSPSFIMAARLFYDIPSTLLKIGGEGALARFMTSPQFVQWLTRVPRVAIRGVDSPAFQAHMVRLNTLAADDKEIGQAVLNAVGDVLRPANAGPGPGAEAQGEPQSEVAPVLFGGRRAARPQALVRGLVPGQDEKPRFEIDDSKSAIISNVLDAALAKAKSGEAVAPIPLSTIFAHDEFYKQYPQARDIKIKIQTPEESRAAFKRLSPLDQEDDPNNGGTYFDRENNTIRVGLMNPFLRRMGMRKLLLHELQHWMQGKEGFKYGSFKDQHDLRPGEIEARFVQNRADMSAADRAANPPVLQSYYNSSPRAPASRRPKIQESIGVTAAIPGYGMAYGGAEVGRDAPPSDMMKLGGPREDVPDEPQQPAPVNETHPGAVDYTGLKTLMHEPYTPAQQMDLIGKVAPDLLPAFKAFHDLMAKHYPQSAKNPSALIYDLDPPEDAPSEIKALASQLDAELRRRMSARREHAQ